MGHFESMVNEVYFEMGCSRKSPKALNKEAPGLVAGMVRQDELPGEKLVY